MYSTDEGLTWNSHSFGASLRVQTIQTVPDDTSRRFLLIGFRMSEPEKSVLVHLDFSAITQQKCKPSDVHGASSADAQACGTLTTRIGTISSSGRRVRSAMRSASLDVRPCTGDGSVTKTVTLVTEWTSRRRSSGTVLAKRQTLNGTSGVAPSRCLLIPLANSTIIEIQRGNVSWLRALPRCLQTPSTSSATGPLRTGTSALPTARSHTRLARVESDLIVASNMLVRD